MATLKLDNMNLAAERGTPPDEKAIQVRPSEHRPHALDYLARIAVAVESWQPLRSDGSVTVLVELGPETLQLLADIRAGIRRLADHFDPSPPDVVDTPYIACRLGCTTTWIAQMVRSGDIPKACIVPGSGKGRQWKFYRRRIEDWLANR